MAIPEVIAMREQGDGCLGIICSRVPEEDRGTLHWSGPLVSAETAASAW